MKESVSKGLAAITKFELNLKGWFAIYALLSMVIVVGWVVVMIIESVMGW